MCDELWKTIFDSATVILLFLTFVAGAGALIFGNRINKKQAESLRKFDRDLTAAKTELEEEKQKTAKAQLELRKFIEDVNTARGPRMIIDNKAFVAALRGKPTAKAEILFAPNDEEAYELALQIRRWLGPGDKGDGAGWDVKEPQPIPPEGGDPRIPRTAPPAIRYGALGGMAIISNRLWNPLDKNPSYDALMDAFITARLVGTGERVPTLPDNLFIIVIGQRR